MQYQKKQKESKKSIILSEIFTPKAIFEELVYGSLAGTAICLGGHPFE